MDILDERMGAFHTEMDAMMGTCTLMFREFRDSGAPYYLGAKDPITGNRWLADVANAFRSSRVPRGTRSDSPRVF